MLQFKKITLEDKPIINPYLQELNCNLLNYCFVVQFIYRDLIHFEYAIYKDFLLLKVNVDQREKFLYPVGKGDVFPVFDALKSYSYERNGKFTLFQFCDEVSEVVLSWAETLKKVGLTYELIPERAEFEYIYLADDLANLEGNKLKRKRNHVNAFLKTYPYQVEKISQENLPEVMLFDEKWNQNREISSGSRLLIENIALQECFRYYEELELEGLLLKVENQIVAFSLGCPLNEDTYFVLFEKADRDYNGAYNMINREFVRHIASGYQYINRAEDCGDLGLRKAKLSYAPYCMNEVYYLNVTEA